MKAIPITQRCKSPMKLSDKTLAANAQSLDKFEDSAGAKIGGAVSAIGSGLGEAMKK
jgi:hypothetical protein